MTDHLKIAVGIEGVERLRQEAAVLEAARHPGVVELLAFTDEGGVAELRTVPVDGPPLAAADVLGDDEVAGLAAAVATTLADLHDVGVCHGALDASHILLGAGGPVLCGFGTGGQPADDVAALGRLVLELAERGPVADVARELGRCTAREAAAAFRTCVATATLPGRNPADADPLRDLLGRGDRQRRRRPVRRWLVAAVVFVVAGAIALVSLRPAPATVEALPPAPTTTAVSTTVPPAPSATLVWPPASGPAPTFALDGRRFTAGQPGDIALAGPFGCDGAGGTAAVLRPTSGQVFVFTDVASSEHDVTSSEVATVLGGRALRSEDADGDGCVDLLVERSDGEPVPVALS